MPNPSSAPSLLGRAGRNGNGGGPSAVTAREASPAELVATPAPLRVPAVAPAPAYSTTLAVTNATLDATGTDPMLFTIVGDIVGVDGWTQAGRGKFYGKGVVLPNGPEDGALSLVDHRFKLPGQGTIFGAGSEHDSDGEPFAVLGGTGRFIGLRGTYTFTGLPMPLGDGAMSFTFTICR